MSGVALDVPVASSQPRSFWRLLWAVILGSFIASVVVLVFAYALSTIAWLPSPSLYPAPFPVDGTWTLAADLGAATVFVLVVALSVWLQVEYAVRSRVSFGVVVLAVALIGYAPFVALGSPRLLGIVTLPAMTWMIRRYAIGTALPVPSLSWRVWAALGVVALGVVASYGVYHPLAADRFIVGIDARASGRYFIPVTLSNPGLADVTILRVDSGQVNGRWHPHTLPWTLDGRSQTELMVSRKGCAPPDVTITYSILGLTSSQRFTVGTLSSCQR